MNATSNNTLCPFDIKPLSPAARVRLYNCLVAHLDIAPFPKEKTFKDTSEAQRKIAGAIVRAQSTPALWADTVTTLPPEFMQLFPPGDPGLHRFNKLPLSKQRLLAIAWLLGAYTRDIAVESIAMYLQEEVETILPYYESMAHCNPPYIVMDKDGVELLTSTNDWLQAFGESILQDFDPINMELGELTTPENNDMAKKAATKKTASKKAATKTAKTKTEGASPRGRKSTNTGQTFRITYKPESGGDPNPRRSGTHGHQSFQILLGLVKKGGKTTFEEYIAAGGRAKDLDWDVAKGYVSRSDK